MPTSHISIFLAVLTSLIGLAAHASCPASPPVSIKTQSGDQTVNAAWLEKTLGGMKVVFEGEGRENYKADGSYSYTAGSNTWSAESFRFYNDGTRCIGYSNPRFDRYVVRDSKLVLINAQGDRLVGKLVR